MWLLCVLAGHTEPLCSNQSAQRWLENHTVLALGHLTQKHTHTILLRSLLGNLHRLTFVSRRVNLALTLTTDPKKN